jgi:hypothetical protein
VRVAAYLVLMAGYRGVGFRADAELTGDTGRACLYEMAIVNAELDLVEAILAEGAEPQVPLSSYPPDPKPVLVFNPNTTMGSMSQRANATNNPQRSVFPETKPHPSIRGVAIPTADNRGRLVLLADMSERSQFQPPQAAINDLKVVVPGAPEGALAFEISLGGVRYLERDRQPGGLRASIPAFDVATMVLVTTDLDLVKRLDAEITKIAPRAVDLAIKEAKRQTEWVAKVHDRLVKDDHKVRDGDDLVAESFKLVKSAEEAQANEDYRMAWDEARRCGRGLRLMMRDHWDRAFSELEDIVEYDREQAYRRAKNPRTYRLTPRRLRFEDPKTGAWRKPSLAPAQRVQLPAQIVLGTSSPPLVAFNTLPQHFIWMDWLESGTRGEGFRFSRNLLPTGNFEVSDPRVLVSEGWVDASYHDEKIKSAVVLEPRAPGKPGKVLRLAARPVKDEEIDALPPFFDYPLAAVRTPPIPVATGSFVRIRFKIKLPRMVTAGGGGLLVQDSLGGERLQFRRAEYTENWTDVVLLRRAPADTDLTVTLGMAALGDAFFDDLRIEILERESRNSPAPTEDDLVRRRPTERPLNPDPPGRRAAARSTLERPTAR